MEKRERGSNIIFHIILRLLERILSGEEGKWTENGVGEEYQVVRKFIHPWFKAGSGRKEADQAPSFNFLK